MSDLDSVVKPILTRPVLGHPAQFTLQEQLEIATWACMKAMVFEFAWAQPPAFTQPEREIVRTQKRPTASAQVRIAAIETQGYPLRAFRHDYKLHTQEGSEAVCLTIMIGCFVIQVFGGPGTKQHGLQDLGEIGSDYISIYPPVPNQVSWPPAVSMTDGAIDDFAHPLSPLTGG
ncbi:hypothetical protein ACIPN8_37330 [Streptomyces sp. NPDC086082]|uniref:hypothetical protein n=1 Tax=Streptomyces sp. NPDC086082 TaxID=3365750 RepID=UPI00381B48F2